MWNTTNDAHLQANLANVCVRTSTRSSSSIQRPSLHRLLCSHRITVHQLRSHRRWHHCLPLPPWRPPYSHRHKTRTPTVDKGSVITFCHFAYHSWYQHTSAIAYTFSKTLLSQTSSFTRSFSSTTGPHVIHSTHTRAISPRRFCCRRHLLATNEAPRL